MRCGTGQYGESTSVILLGVDKCNIAKYNTYILIISSWGLAVHVYMKLISKFSNKMGRVMASVQSRKGPQGTDTQTQVADSLPLNIGCPCLEAIFIFELFSPLEILIVVVQRQFLFSKNIHSS